MKKSLFRNLSLSLFLMILAYVTPYRFLYLIFIVPILYLFYSDGNRGELRIKHFLFLAGLGSFIVLFPASAYSFKIYIFASLLSTLLLFLFYFLLDYLVYKMPDNFIQTLIPPFLWTAICIFLNYMGISAVIMDIGVHLPYAAPIIWFTGSIGITFLLVWLNSLLAFAIYKKSKLSYAIFTILLIIFICSFNYSVNGRIKNTHTKKVVLVQGNIHENWQWSQRNAYIILEQYEKLSLIASKENPDIIIWPEYSFPLDIINYNSQLFTHIENVIKKAQTSFLIGSILYDEKTGLHDDLGILFNRNGAIIGKYSSVSPLSFNQFTKQSDNQIKPINDVGIIICWEEKNEAIARKMTNKGAQYLVVLTNEQDIDRSWFLPFTADFAKARASENRRYLARSTNTGITYVVNPLGIVTKQFPVRKAGYLVGELKMIKQRTFYTQFGPIIVYLVLLYILFVLIFNLKKYQNK